MSKNRIASANLTGTVTSRHLSSSKSIAALPLTGALLLGLSAAGLVRAQESTELRPAPDTRRQAGNWKAVDPADTRRQAGTWEAVDPTDTRRQAGTWKAVDPADTRRQASAPKTTKSTASPRVTSPRAGEAARNGVARSTPKAAAPKLSIHPAAKQVQSVGRKLAKGGAVGVAIYGVGEIVSQEINDPGKTVRDIKSGNIHVDAGELAAVGAAAMAGGFLPGLAAYGVVKIVDQEIKDPGKTARDIKKTVDNVGRAAEDVSQAVGRVGQNVGEGLESATKNVGSGIDKATKDVSKGVEKTAKDVGNFLGGLFDKR